MDNRDIIVLAANVNMAREWVQNHPIDDVKRYIIATPHNIRGLHDVDLVLVEGWYHAPNLTGIVSNLFPVLTKSAVAKLRTALGEPVY